jgi:hypothetical protein
MERFLQNHPEWIGKVSNTRDSQLLAFIAVCDLMSLALRGSVVLSLQSLSDHR